MRSKKKYTNLTFTKRVDHESGHVSKLHPKEPGLCKKCGAVYMNARWYPDIESAGFKHPNELKAEEGLCPACEQVKTGVPQGFVYIDAELYSPKREEIDNLMRNEEKKLMVNNPLARRMGRDVEDNRIVVKTTTVHLAQHLGRAIQRAFGGDVRYDFSHENQLVRVYLTKKN